MTKYVECAASDVPESVRFDTNRRDQGQIVEISWGDYPQGRSENGPGDAYKRRIDHSTGKTTFYRRIDAES